MCAEAAARHKADLDAHYNLLILERQARDAESRAAIAAEEQASKDRIEQYTQYSLHAASGGGTTGSRSWPTSRATRTSTSP